MSVTKRFYDPESDFETVSGFLIRLYQEDPPRNWLQPRWVYAHSHPLLETSSLGRMPIWEDGGEIVAAVLFESKPGINYPQLDARYACLKRDVLEAAKRDLEGELKAGRGAVVYLDDRDQDFSAIAAELGFQARPEHAETSARLFLRHPLPRPRLPRGFVLQSLADEFDLEKVHRVMHRGFNHAGEPPRDELEERRRKLSAPALRRDLTMVCVAPNGDYASFCGIWPVPASHACYIEPVATDPDYRRMGLGTAVVMEAVRRCADEGAAVAYVGSDQEFYLSMGFEICARSSAWWLPSA